MQAWANLTLGANPRRRLSPRDGSLQAGSGEDGYGRCRRLEHEYQDWQLAKVHAVSLERRPRSSAPNSFSVAL